MDKTLIVYVVKCNEFYKIGSTSDLRRRLIALQTGNPYPITLIHSYEIPVSAETSFHNLLTKIGCHERGEWFKISEDLLVTVLQVLGDYEKDYKRRMEAAL
jgi:hypothetical protein